MPNIAKPTVAKVLEAMKVNEIVHYDDVCARVPDQARKTIKFAMRQLIDEGAVEQAGGTSKNPLFRRVNL